LSKQEQRTVIAPSPTPICTACFDFTREEDGQYEKRTIIIAPIVVEEKSSGFFQIGWACSRSGSCQDRLCRYSHTKKRKYANEEADIEHLGSFGDR